MTDILSSATRQLRAAPRVDSSPTSRRIRRRRSTPRCGSASQLREVLRGAQLRVAGSTSDERIAEMMREVALPDDPSVPAPLPARALRWSAAAGRVSRWRSPTGRA
ncbi:MAG: hypothetical protein WKF73_15410 [Nocardioidaceae bacterium]